MRLNEIKVGTRFRQDYGDITRLGKSIETHGLLQPLVINQDGELLAGGRRYQACTDLGLLDVPVRVIDTTDKREQLLIELEENLERKDLVWSEEVALKKAIDVLLKERDSGHTQKATAQMLGETPANTSRDIELAAAMEVFPELKDYENKYQAARAYRKMKEDATWTLKMGQQRAQPKQYKWAEAHYHIGDAIEGLLGVPENTIHFFECDPPYGLTHDQVKSANATTEELTTANTEGFHVSLLNAMYRAAYEHAYIVLWHAMSQLPLIHRVLTQSQFKFSEVPAIWLKPGASFNTNPDRVLSPRYECFTLLRKGTPKMNRPRDNVFEFARVQDRIRHAEKPIALYTEFLDVFTRPGMNLCSPFLGSGNFLLACYDKGRTAFGWEMDETLKPQFLSRVQKRYFHGGNNGATGTESGSNEC